MLERCHWIDPVFPATLTDTPEPEQIVPALVSVTVPDTDGWVTVTTIGPDIEGTHGVLVILTL